MRHSLLWLTLAMAATIGAQQAPTRISKTQSPSTAAFTDTANTFQQVQTLSQGLQVGTLTQSLACGTQSEGLVQYVKGTPPASGAIQVCENQGGSYVWAALSSAGQAPVQSVAGRTQNITLTHNDITDWNSAVGSGGGSGGSGLINTDTSIANLGTQYSASGLPNVLALACGVPINDGTVHTVGNAPAGSCFNGVTTIAGLAAVSVNGTQPFAWLTHSAPVAFSNNLLQVGYLNAGSGGTNGVFQWTATGGGCTTEPSGNFTVTNGSLSSIQLSTHGAGCTSAPAIPLNASAGLYGVVLNELVLSDSVVSKIDISWLAIQTALLSGKAYLPAGRYIVGSTIPQPLILSAPGSDQSFSGMFYTIAGDGPRTSVIKAGSDWGAGFHLLICGDPAGTKANRLGRYGGNYPGDMHGIGLFSSANSLVFPMGTVAIQMDGMGWGARLRLQDTEFSGFNHDMTVVGDHTAFVRVHLFGGAVGMYLATPNPYNFGDLQFLDFNASAQSQAAIEVGNHATLIGVFEGETFLMAPYSILGEADTDHTCAAIANSVVFDRLMAEDTGNALIADDTNYANGIYTDSNKCRNVSQTIIKDLYFSWDNQDAAFVTGNGGSHFWGGVGGRQRRAAIDVNGMSLTVQHLECSSGCWTPSGTSAGVPTGSTPISTINLSAYDLYGASFIKGAVNEWIGRSGTLPLLTFTAGPMYQGLTFENQNGDWGGFIDQVNGNPTYPTLSAGDVIQFGGQFVFLPGGTTNDNSPPAGICAQSGVPIGTYVPIVTHGQQGVNIGYQVPGTVGPWKMATGIGYVYITTAGSGGTDGTYSWTANGGYCATEPAGQYTVTNGAITSATITNYGTGCTASPVISLGNSAGVMGARLTPKWPAAIAVPATSWSDAFTLGTGRSPMNATAAGNATRLYLKGLH